MTVEQRIPGYRLLGALGEGGMGVVYRARRDADGRTVAIKLLPPHLHEDREAQGRFLREAILLSALRHPNICAVEGSGETEDGRFYLAVELYRGETLQRRLARELPRLEVALDIARQTAAGLGAAHERGITHRDVKPANLILEPGGRVKILDFGLAQLAAAGPLGRDGQILGTAAYAAPEQLRGEPSDGRADLWSLGVVLYETLTGRVPFPGPDRARTLAAVEAGPPPPLAELATQVPPAVQAIVDRALAREPAERFAAARDLEAALAAARAELGRGPVLAPATPPPPARGLLDRLLRRWRALR